MAGSRGKVKRHIPERIKIAKSAVELKQSTYGNAPNLGTTIRIAIAQGNWWWR
jgi:hypothetical protein